MNRRGVTTLLAVIAVFGLIGLSADQAFSGEPATTYKAGEAGATKANANDPVSMLAQCDRELEACKTDAVGMPYLVTAYLILWAILMVYFFLARRGQQALQAELSELRARLRDYEDKNLGTKAE